MLGCMYTILSPLALLSTSKEPHTMPKIRQCMPLEVIMTTQGSWRMVANGAPKACWSRDELMSVKWDVTLSGNRKCWTKSHLTWFCPLKHGPVCRRRLIHHCLSGIHAMFMRDPRLHSHSTLSHIHWHLNLKHMQSVLFHGTWGWTSRGIKLLKNQLQLN